MKIIVLTGSPHQGSTYLLVQSFCQGAKSSHHDVEIIDVTKLDIHPCIGCIQCGYEGPCCQKDDMEELKYKILKADMLVLATPLYYYGMSSQLKTVIDRFCAMNSSLQRKQMKSALLTVAWNNDNWTFDALELHYQTLVRYLHMQNMGMILGYGCGTPAMTKQSGYLAQAFELGKNLV